jgi:predicted FMN-binding regulatory protein PaiB
MYNMLTFSRILLSMSASTSALHEPSAATANPNRPIKRHLKGNVGCVTVEVVDAKGESSLDQNMANSQSSECRRWVSENGVYMVYQQLVNVFQRQHDELWDLHMDLL